MGGAIAAVAGDPVDGEIGLEDELGGAFGAAAHDEVREAVGHVLTEGAGEVEGTVAGEIGGFFEAPGTDGIGPNLVEEVADAFAEVSADIAENGFRESAEDVAADVHEAAEEEGGGADAGGFDFGAHAFEGSGVARVEGEEVGSSEDAVVFSGGVGALHPARESADVFGVPFVFEPLAGAASVGDNHGDGADANDGAVLSEEVAFVGLGTGDDASTFVGDAEEAFAVGDVDAAECWCVVIPFEGERFDDRVVDFEDSFRVVLD